MGERLYWWLTDDAWEERGHAGPMPGLNQMGLFG